MMTGEAPLQRRLLALKGRGDKTDPDEILSSFLDYTSEIGLELYPAQEEAILSLLEWKHVVLNTPTGSGKSLVAMAMHFQAMAENRASFYTCPIKALVNQKFFDLCDLFGAGNVGLLTGDACVNRDAPILCCTAEILANLALRDEHVVADYVVMDEFHFYGDRERGAAWQIPLVTLPGTLFLLMSATLGDVTHIAEELKGYTGREIAVVRGGTRPVPLEFEYRETPLHETIEDLVRAGEAPVYLVNFTQRACGEEAQSLLSVNVCSREEKQAILREIEGFRFDTPYGKELSRFIRSGIGVHHAGLLPKYRLLVEKLSQAGLLKVVSGTDSLGVGVNIPIRTVVFTRLCKYDGERTGILSARQFHQIAGRAGRKGFDDHGKVAVQAPEHVIENKRIELKIKANPHLKNKLVKKRPPEKGYVHWDKSTFDRLLKSEPEPLEPVFEASHGMIVNVLRCGDPGRGYPRLLSIIGRAHLSQAEKRRQRKRAAVLFRSLVRAGLVEIVPRQGKGATVRLRGDLQTDFSLHQTLSLYLVMTLDLLDADSVTHGLDMLSLVEAVVEDPDVILMRQVDRIKDELVPRLKAEGVEYEKRMEILERIEHPKPLREFIYETFSAFAETHPWVGEENIRPKSVARDMFERCLGFNDYVKEYGMARAEGVLLRYLSQVYKNAIQTVPTSHWTDEFEDVLAFLRTVVYRTDASLLAEWESMMDGEPVRPVGPLGDEISTQAALGGGAPKAWRGTSPQAGLPGEILVADFKAFSRRVRTELHLLLRALASQDYEEACNLVRQTEENAWTADRFKEAMVPYFEAHASIDVTPAARRNEYTLIREAGPKRFEAIQRIKDPEGDEDWALHGVVDLTQARDESEPLIELIRIGV